MQRSREQVDRKQSHLEIHELCQPLTSLQCRLELGRMLGDPQALEEAIEGGLEDTRRMFQIIDDMRQRLAKMEKQAHSTRENSL